VPDIIFLAKKAKSRKFPHFTTFRHYRSERNFSQALQEGFLRC